MSTGPDQWEKAIVISRHRTYLGAAKSLVKQKMEALQKGKHSRDGVVLVESNGKITQLL
jgi:hypothetical protein